MPSKLTRKFQGGAYDLADPPRRRFGSGRAASRTRRFRSLASLRESARDEIITGAPPFGWYEMNASVESYMLHQGAKFVERFDANSYLRILDGVAMVRHRARGARRRDSGAVSALPQAKFFDFSRLIPICRFRLFSKAN